MASVVMRARIERGNTAATWVIAGHKGFVVALRNPSMTGIDISAAPTVVARLAPNPVSPLCSASRCRPSVSNLGVGTACRARARDCRRTQRNLSHVGAVVVDCR